MLSRAVPEAEHVLGVGGVDPECDHDAVLTDVETIDQRRHQIGGSTTCPRWSMSAAFADVSILAGSSAIAANRVGVFGGGAAETWDTN